MVICISSHNSSKKSCMFSRVPGSRAPNGSSMSSILGFMIRAWAMATRCLIPPDNSWGYLWRWSFKFTFSRKNMASSSNSFLFFRLSKKGILSLGPSRTFPSTVLCGNKEYFWYTIPLVESAKPASFPSMSNTPADGNSWPRISRSRVDFPHPLGPTTVTISPAFTARSISSSTTLLP